jgi:integrase/recombinase XerC
MSLISPQSPVSTAVDAFLDNVATFRSPGTARTYRHALKNFLLVLGEQKIETVAALANPTAVLPLSELFKRKKLSPATQQLYSQAVLSFYQFLLAEIDGFPLNLARVRQIFSARTRKPGRRLPTFPKDEIGEVIDYANELAELSREKLDAEEIAPRQHRANLRDRAFILTLADTGLRVHEACGLRVSDLDLDELRAVVIGKGDREDVVRFSVRAVSALRDYLAARAPLDLATGRPLTVLPLFARHNKAGEKRKNRTVVLPISTTTGRNIIDRVAGEALGPEAARSISPHKFRHYFVTSVMQGSGGDIRLAQKLARHQNIQVTERYHHLTDEELDKGYHDLFNVND